MDLEDAGNKIPTLVDQGVAMSSFRAAAQIWSEVQVTPRNIYLQKLAAMVLSTSIFKFILYYLGLGPI